MRVCESESDCLSERACESESVSVRMRMSANVNERE